MKNHDCSGGFRVAGNMIFKVIDMLGYLRFYAEFPDYHFRDIVVFERIDRFAPSIGIVYVPHDGSGVAVAEALGRTFGYIAKVVEQRSLTIAEIENSRIPG